MLTCGRILIILGTTLACTSSVTAFFLNWGASDTPTVQQNQQWPVATYYQNKQYPVPPPQGYAVHPDSGVPVQIPAVPIGVPLPAQFSPTNIRHVQLVPCLCPVSQDLDFEKPQENIYLNQDHRNK